MTGESRDTIEGAVALSAARRRAIVEDRTRRLAARARAPEAPQAGRRRVLVCSVGTNLYGLPLEQVARVRPLGRLGAAPARAASVLGFVADAGRIRPALDLAALLGAQGSGPAASGWLIVLAPPLNAVLRVAELPVAAEVEPLEGGDPDKARIVDEDHAGKILALVSARDLIAASPPTLILGADAP